MPATHGAHSGMGAASQSSPGKGSGSFRAEMRERALAAAEQQLLENGWDRVRLASIAKAAGVSRPTLYAEFGNKDGLGLALVMREADGFLDGVSRRLKRNDDPVKAMRSVITYALTEPRRSPLLLGVLTTTNHDSDEFLPLLTTRSEPLLERATRVVTNWWIEAYPYLDGKRAASVFEAVIRLVLSYVMVPGPSTRQLPGRLTEITTILMADDLAAIERHNAGRKGKP